MIRNQGPGPREIGFAFHGVNVALGLGFFEDDGEPFQERLAVLVVEKDLSSFDSPGHDVLQKAGGV